MGRISLEIPKELDEKVMHLRQLQHSILCCGKKSAKVKDKLGLETH
jgi:hypothetical protein